MALGNPVLSFGSRQSWRSSRVIELAVVVGLTVAVVIVAAVWGGPSTGSPSESVASMPASSTAPADRPSQTAVPLPAERSMPASAESVEVELATTAMTRESASQARVVPIQTGIVPGRPDPLEPTTPDSFDRYQVQRGESLFSIAAAQGLSVTDLVRWNRHLREDSALIHGEWLWIPEWDLPAVAGETGSRADEGKSGRGGG